MIQAFLVKLLNIRLLHNMAMKYSGINALYVGVPLQNKIECIGVQSIVKLNTTCDKQQFTFYIKHHQNESKNISIIFSWVDVHGIYYIVKIGNQTWWFDFCKIYYF